MTPPLRVGIDARALEREDDLRGVGVVVWHMIRHLRAAGVHLVLFFNHPPDGRLTSSADKQVVLGSSTPKQARPESTTLLRPVRDLLWEQFRLPRALRRERLDLYHAPANRGIPLIGQGRFVATIHDVIPLVTPYFFDRRTNPPIITGMLRFVAWVSLALVTWKSRRIITDSEASRRDIVRYFPWARGKMTVIYAAADPRYRRVEDATVIKRVLTRYALPSRFLIFVGGLGQRKNIAGLLHAYAHLLRALPTVPALVVVGQHNALYNPLQQMAHRLRIADRVHFPGFVPTEDMPALLSAADLLVYPSFYEGFGLPVLEAMACACPVVCSHTSALPEVGADAVCYCDPTSHEDIADKMRQLLTDGALRAQLVERGLRRAGEFSMDRMAGEVLGVYREVLGSADGIASAGNHRPI
jgi:glycosyltransferase involved in cell wall biosynthesis